MGAKSDSAGNGGDRHLVLRQQLLGDGDTTQHDVGMGRVPGRGTELGGKVHPAQPGGGPQISQVDRLVQVFLNVIDDPFQPPFGERRKRLCALRSKLTRVVRDQVECERKSGAFDKSGPEGTAVLTEVDERPGQFADYFVIGEMRVEQHERGCAGATMDVFVAFGQYLGVEVDAKEIEGAIDNRAATRCGRPLHKDTTRQYRALGTVSGSDPIVLFRVPERARYEMSFANVIGI
jgi:hypothetical protein